MHPNNLGSSAPGSFNGSAHGQELEATWSSLTMAVSGQQELLLSQWSFRMLTDQIHVYTQYRAHAHTHTNIHPHYVSPHTITSGSRQLSQVAVYNRISFRLLLRARVQLSVS